MELAQLLIALGATPKSLQKSHGNLSMVNEYACTVFVYDTQTNTTTKHCQGQVSKAEMAKESK